MYYKIAQLILTPGSGGNSTSEIFVAQPDANKEALAGKLFILAEIESKKADNLKIINFLTEELNHNYYQNEKMILRERVKTITVEHIFEATLAKTNKNLAEFLQTEKMKIDPRIINITAGVIYENNIHFANSGKNKALLIYKNKKDEDAKNIYRIMDIAKNYPLAERSSYGQKDEATTVALKGEEKQRQPNKLFSNVISGPLPPGSCFLFANETLPEYLSAKQLIEIITALPPASAVEQIKNIIARINTLVPFLGLIIKNVTAEEEDKLRGEILTTTRSSISGLNAMEERTEKLLTPGGYINVKKWINGLLALPAKLKFLSTRPENRNLAMTGALRDKITFKKRMGTIRAVAGKTAAAGRNFAVYVFCSTVSFFRFLIKLATNRAKRAEFAGAVKTACLGLKDKTKNAYRWFAKLNGKLRLLFIIGIAALIIFTGNLAITAYKNKKTGRERIAADLTRMIEQKQNQVEASLLYNNEAGARNLLDEIKELLGQLPKNKDGYEEKYAPLFGKYHEHLEKIKHVLVADPQKLADFSVLDTNAAPENIILTNGKIYANDSGQKQIYAFALAKNSAAAVTDAKEKADTGKYPVADKDNNIYYFSNGNIVQLNAGNDKTKILNIELASPANEVKAMSYFNNKLYLLHRDLNQIYTYRKGGDKFFDSSLWIKEKTDLNNAVDMDIDGAVYILKNDGQLLKFLKGRLEDFSLAPVEPALERSVKVIAKSESNYIYIFEPTNKRLVVFNKEGKFILQYQMENLSDLKDFTVDEAGKTIYFLNNSSLYKIEAKHLK